MITDLIQLIIFFLILVITAYPFGRFMACIFSGKKHWSDKLFNPIEKLLFKIIHVDPNSEMNWIIYAISLLIFNGVGFLFLFLFLVFQRFLPLNPMHLPGLRPDLAFNTAISFMTNTNWQSYAGEITLSPLSQMAGLTVQNFLSAATGIVVAIALIRGLIRKQTTSLGNFWSDISKTIIRILLPLALIFSIFLVSQGVVQRIQSNVTYHTLEGQTQQIIIGPVASQESIKLIGTNGGGYFNSNSSHPFENPTPLSNMIEIFLFLFLPSAIVFMFGSMVKDKKQGIVLFVTMLCIFLILLGGIYFSEKYGNTLLTQNNLSSISMEGKEVRFGIFGSSLFATATTSVSCGAVNSMHSSYTPLAGMFLMLPIMLGEIIFGGAGSGFYGLILFVILTVFIVGLMVGRTPEYLGKKIESFEMKMASIGIMIPSALILIGTALAVVLRCGTSSLLNQGPHGLSEILYAFSSAAGNNGSAFAGLNANTVFYNVTLGLSMLIGRFGVIIPILGISGNMVQKKVIPVGSGTFHTTTPLFFSMLIFVILIVGLLTFFPALLLGPILEHFHMLHKISF